MITKFLTLQSTYTSVECALFYNKNLIQKIVLDKAIASQQLLNALGQLLTNNQLSLADISFAAVNTGPAPFTTLRVVIATINGIGFASPLPLIGIDGLHAMTQEYFIQKNKITVLMLNAFNKDVYFALHNSTGEIEKGCAKLDQFLVDLKKKFTAQQTPLTFMGSGALLYKKEIETTFTHDAQFLHTNVDHPSIEQIGTLGWQAWQKQTGLSKKIVPSYLKTQTIS